MLLLKRQDVQACSTPHLECAGGCTKQHPFASTLRQAPLQAKCVEERQRALAHPRKPFRNTRRTGVICCFAKSAGRKVMALSRHISCLLRQERGARVRAMVLPNMRSPVTCPPSAVCRLAQQKRGPPQLVGQPQRCALLYVTANVTSTRPGPHSPVRRRLHYFCCAT